MYVDIFAKDMQLHTNSSYQIDSIENHYNDVHYSVTI